MKRLKEFIPLWKHIKEDRKKFIFASFLIFIHELANTLTGYLNGAAVEAITKLEVKNALIYLLIYFVVSIVFDDYLHTLGSSILQSIENKLSRKLSFFTYKKSVDLPAYAYEKMSSGEVINRVVNDADSLSFAFGRLLELFSSCVGSIIVLIYVLFNSWIIALEIIVFIIVLFFIIRKYNPKLINVHKERKNEQDKYTSIVNESIRGVREIKTLGIKKSLIHDISESIKQIFNKSNEEIDIQKKFTILTRNLKTLLEVGVFVTCVILLSMGEISLTFFIAMTYYVYRFMYLIENINNFVQTYQKLYVSLTRVNEIMENRLYNDESFGDKTIKNVKGIIEFKNITFHYPDEDNILRNFNLKLEPNKKIAIIGRSGQGKSTLFNLLTRVFDVTEGEILLDGVDIKELREDVLRKEISIIRQEPFIFNRTILENFKLIDSDIDLKKVRKYCKMAYLDDYIMSLPDKYDTLLGEGGVNLSGGQKQRLAIARTLAKQSKVILFDEATSALDNSSQSFIKKTIDHLVENHTVIIVAHRLSTIVDADIIYLVDEGKVVAQGKHNELLKSNLIYQNLYESESLNS